MKIDALKLDYKSLNRAIHSAVKSGDNQLTLVNVNGQRFIASGIDAPVNIKISGVPGNDLGTFMNGPVITLDGNAQDAVGNTMSGGKIIVNGHAGDAAGYSMRGGKIFIRGDVGYRAGIHMKQYKDSIPIIVIGGRAKDFLGEYMAGGIIVALGLNKFDNIFGKSKFERSPLYDGLNLARRHNNGARSSCCGNYLGTGMHGGVIYIPRGKKPLSLSKGLKIDFPKEEEKKNIRAILEEFVYDIKTLSPDEKKAIFRIRFVKIHPASHRPYGNLYAY